MTTTDALVDVVTERLQVDIGGIEPGQEAGQGLLTDVARCDEDVPKACLMGQTGTVRHIFQIGEWLGIGVGDAWTVVLQTEVDDLLRGEVVVSYVVWRHLRDVMVLTVQTAEITACAGYRQTRGTRMEVVEWFLFDGVDGQRAGLPIDFTDQYTVVIAATATDTCLAVGNTTMMRTEITLNHTVV